VILSDKVFQLTFLISLIAHGVILLQNPNFSIFQKAKKNNMLEMRYVKAQEKALNPVKLPALAKELPLKSAIKLGPENREKLYQKSRQIVADKDTFSRASSRPQADFIKPALIKPDITGIKKKITLPAIGVDKIDNPVYLNYYQMVREKIRRAAYQHYARPETGEVYLSFIIASDGYLKGLRIIDEKSSPSDYLKEAALQSVKEATPLPNFPKELDYPQLSFNIVISFEIE